jgi:hypothetical protein
VGSSLASEMCAGASRREVRSLSSRVYDIGIDIDLHARINGLEDHIKLIMEDLRILEVKTVAPV